MSRGAGTEFVFTVGGGTSRDAVTASLRALLPTRHHPITRHRFTVLDTFDGRVRRAGARLTRTGANGSSTVSWQPPTGHGLQTTRLTAPVSFAWDLPNGHLQQALGSVVGVRRLLPQAEAEQDGTALDVLDQSRKTVARLRIQSGQVRLPRARSAWQPLPTIVTLTCLRGYEDVCQQLVPVVESRPYTKSCPEGLDGLILRCAGVPDVGDLSSLEIDLAPGVTAEAGARQIHRAVLDVLVANEPGLRENLDTEFLHDFRVAVRRTRSVLRQLKHAFPPDAVERFSSGFSWLGRLTGPPRDLDVLLLALKADLRDADAADVQAVVSFLEAAQQRARHALVAALDSERYKNLLSHWRSFLERPDEPCSDASDAQLPLDEVVSRRAWKLSRRMTRNARALDEQADAAALHAVRIDAKKLRYLVDVARRFYDAADLERILAALKKVQRALGDFNDAQMQEARLLEYGRALGAAGGPASAVLALGQLAERRRQQRERLRPHVADLLAHFDNRATRSACKRAFRRAPGLEPTR